VFLSPRIMFLRECISMITEERAAGYLEDVEFDY
jgi:hypothetical protein